ncbi:extracellular solute-binding protein [Bradyrhizobium sp. LA6.10]|uniref:extracellular solute-binding protein n=1 Tax=Bradyrhizobium sp. LA6.10 TaxID=3156318 RepID=UPI0033942DAE
MFEAIDYSLWDAESLECVQEPDRRKDAVVVFQSAQLLAYDERAFPKGGPKNWIDFWDIKKFPGSRELYAPLGKYDFPFALIADGVDCKEIWPLTDEKLDRAFAKLNEIKPHITKWWSAGGESPQLLTNGEYAMTSAYDGRAFSAIRQGAPIKFAWDGAYLNHTFVTVLKRSPNTANAQKFVAFLNRADIAAGFTQATGYPSPNVNQLKYLPAAMLPQVSINPENASKVVREDSDWLAAKRLDGKTNADHIQERWLAWRAK